jgi:hypothetical protein
MAKPDQEFRSRFWSNRGISPEVAKERGYLRYEKHDPSKVKPHFAALSPGQKATVTRKAKAEHGLAIIRFAVLEHLEKPVPELRPDDPISTETRARTGTASGSRPSTLRTTTRWTPRG